MTVPTAMVTGAGGFIGSHLVHRLAAAGTQVVAIDIRPRPEALSHPGVRYEQLDIRDADRIAELLPGIDTVFHLASVHLSVHAGPAEFAEVNVGAAERLVEICASAGVRRLVHTSSVGVYGHVENPPASEDSPKRPISLYERTKLAGEEAVRLAAQAHGLSAVVLRPAWVYGPGCPRTEKLIHALRKGRFFFVGSGSNRRHPLYIDEMVDAFLRAAEAENRENPGCYIVAGPRAVSLRELVNSFADAAGARRPSFSLPRPAAVGIGYVAELAFRPLRREPPFSRRSLAFFENDNEFSTEAARRDLGFEPKVELEEGLRRTLTDTLWRAAA